MPKKKDGVIWDLSSFFPEFNSTEMVEFKNKLRDDIAQLQSKASKIGILTRETAPVWEEIILDAENYASRFNHIDAYIECIAAAHADRDEYQQEVAKIVKFQSEYEKFEVYVLEAFKAASDDVFAEFTSHEKLKDIAHALRRLREKAQHTMSRSEEILASDLGVDGFHSWGRLYDNITGKLEFEMKMPSGRKLRKPISEWRSLMGGPDREIGRAAYEGGNKTWESIESTCAAALNAISGTRLALNKHRGYDHFLDKALFQASIKRETLDAMYSAIHETIEIPREIFRAKAKYMGRDGIWWFEREAPLPLKDTGKYSWKSGTAMVTRAFDTVYPGLSEYFKMFLKKKWVESESRGGKRPGAFCTGSSVTKEQRVYMTFNDALGDVTTLAHEVGHAFHGHLLRDLRPFARRYPMTLAETASIFAELILAEGIYEDKSITDDAKLLMLDADICNAAVLLLDITVRFEFEKAFHEERMNGEVSVARLKELMTETQKRIFGDSMLPGSEDPLFWASKLHFYITHVTFYNFPYTFGFLLARALNNLFHKEGAAFLPKYEAFLRMTGSDTVENVAMKSIGADITSPSFWSESIRSLDGQLTLYKDLLAKRG